MTMGEQAAFEIHRESWWKTDLFIFHLYPRLLALMFFSAVASSKSQLLQTRMLQTTIQMQSLAEQNLVGGLNPSEKYEVNWDDYSQYMMGQ